MSPGFRRVYLPVVCRRLINCKRVHGVETDAFNVTNPSCVLPAQISQWPPLRDGTMDEVLVGLCPTAAAVYAAGNAGAQRAPAVAASRPHSCVAEI